MPSPPRIVIVIVAAAVIAAFAIVGSRGDAKWRRRDWIRECATRRAVTDCMRDRAIIDELERLER